MNKLIWSDNSSALYKKGQETQVLQNRDKGKEGQLCTEMPFQCNGGDEREANDG